MILLEEDDLLSLLDSEDDPLDEFSVESDMLCDLFSISEFEVVFDSLLESLLDSEPDSLLDELFESEVELDSLFEPD